MSCMLLIQGWTKYIPLYILLYRPIPTYTDNSYGEEHFNSRSNGVHPGHGHTHTAEVQQRVSRTLCSITLDTIIHGQEKTGSQSDFSLRVNPRPTVSWLWQKYFTSIIQIPKQSSLLLVTSLTCLPARNTQHCARQPHWNRHMLDPYTCTRHNFTHKSTRNGIHMQQCDRPRACCKQLQWPCVWDIKHTALITHHQTP